MSNETLAVPDEEVLVPIDSAPDSDLELMRQAQLEGELEEEDRADPTGARLDAAEDAEDEFDPESVKALLATPAALISVPKATGTAASMGLAAVKWAGTKVGVKEKPPYSNYIFAWSDVKPSWQGEPWCAAFVTDAWARQGVDLRKVISNPFYCPYLEQMAKTYGAWHAYGSGYSPKAGDISIMGRGHATHTGLAAPAAGNYSGYRQIEGNTSSSNAGSQTNGDGVYVRFRTDFIRGWISMAQLIAALVKKGKLVIGRAASKPRPAAPAKPKISFSVTMKGITGPGKGKFNGNVRIIQGLLHKQSNFKNTRVTGIWTQDSKNNYAAYQKVCGYKGADADGIPGWSTFKRLVEWGGYTAVK